MYLWPVLFTLRCKKYCAGVDVEYLIVTHASSYLFLSAAFLTQTVCLDDTTVKFEIWDTAGQERYHSLAPMYYRGAQAAIVVYDITNEASSFTPDKTQYSLLTLL